jgi:drug/metabolite transporter (DMT)-like permease
MVILAMLFWGLSYVWVKIAYQYLGPISTVVMRLVLSTIIMIVIALMFKIKIFPKKEDLKAFMLLALLEPFGYFIGESLGLKYVSSSIASIMIGTIPLFIPIFAFFILKDKITRNNIIGLIISFVGLLILILDKDFSFQASPLGISLMLLAVLSGALYTIQLKKLSTKYRPETIIINMQAIGLLYFIPVFIFTEWNDFKEVNFNLELTSTLLKLVVFSSLGALYFFIHAVEKIGVTKTSMFTNLIPVVTAISAWIILPEEVLSLKLAIGIVVVIGGVYIGNTRKINFRKYI